MKRMSNYLLLFRFDFHALTILMIMRKVMTNMYVQFTCLGFISQKRGGDREKLLLLSLLMKNC